MLLYLNAKGAEHPNIYRKVFTMEVKGAEHRNIFINQLEI